ncbi:NADPH dehydrogenase NamA [Taibaiella soli]|uniref:NADPH dehydrogenase NamA n=1 Tax=Taibaiella soli TaxID=1649169 RepID=A0A2W2B278_9BACT|nr:NADPH dehydrogenase NamA [Taibaiella soli]PZF74374.1 NADPH dehydrogenase NamA [Taibaiella soli]
MSALFSPLQIREVTFKNRITVSPMCEYSAVDGFANDWHLVHLGSRAVGGAGLIITEATAVLPEGRISPEDLGIWKDEHIAPLKNIVAFLHAHGAVAGIQLAHAGRKASSYAPWRPQGQVPVAEGGWQTVAPSAVPYYETDHTPHALTKQEITDVVNAFAAAAERSLQAGFKVIEIHGAHGYLIHQFLSPLSNKRTDEYGGSFENRIRLLKEIIIAIRTVWPESQPLFVRISATDWVEEGWNVADSIALAKEIGPMGVDLIDCSSGAIIPKVKIPVGPLYQLPLAEAVKKGSGIKTGAVGLITTAEEAESIISSGKADLVLMARQLLRDPYFPLHAAQKLGVDLKWPDQYERAKPR